jgi:oligopeptide transport system substrate-binding protein
VSERPVNGPFLLDEMVPRARIRLTPNPHYHSAAELRVDAVEYYPIEDPGQELARYRSDELDVTETIPPGRFEWLRENLGGELRVAPYLGSFWLGVNLRNVPLGASADLRRALALAVDRETLVRVVLGAGELPAWSVVPPGLDGYAPQPDPAARLGKAEREERSRALYRRAGYGPDRPLRVEVRFNTSTQHRRMAVAVAAMWKQLLGVRTDLIQEEWKVFVNNRRQGVLTEVFRGGWIADFADPVTFLDLFRAGSELNTTFYENPAYDGLLAEAAAHSGPQRMQLLQQAETLLLRDMPVIPLYHYVSRHLVKPRVRGWEDNARDVHLSRYLAIEEGSK